MYAYIKGTIKGQDASSIVLEQQNIGYLIHTPNPYQFQLEEEVYVYVYQYVREDQITLYGFKTPEDKEMFLRLISVKGIGPKGALSILASGTTPQIIEAIESENVTLLKKYPGIGPKAAQQIILDLKGKLAKDVQKVTTSELIDVEEALIALGYNNKAISRVIKQLSGKKGSTDELIRLALQMMLK